MDSHDLGRWKQVERPFSISLLPLFCEEAIEQLLSLSASTRLISLELEEEQEPSTSEFVTPEESELLKQIFAGKATDTRPMSRVGLVQQMNVLSVPTLAIYHLGQRTWLDHNVRASLFESKEQREKAWETWQKAERLEMSWSG